jgi:hypothetical protein
VNQRPDALSRPREAAAPGVPGALVAFVTEDAVPST